VQEGDSVKDVRGLSGGDVSALADLRADGQERGVKATLAQLPEDVRDLRAQLERRLSRRGQDALHLGIQDVAWQAVPGIPKRIIPPATGPASRIVTACPRRVSW
jgi:hypothetical protein